MGDRQYGIMPGTGFNGTPPPPYQPQQQKRRSQSPLKQQIRSPFRDPGGTPSPSTDSQRRTSYIDQIDPQRPDQRQSDQFGPQRPPQRQSWHAGPPPPAHRTLASANQPPRPYAAPSSTSTSEVSLYTPDDSRARALQGVDNLYSPRLASPSPARQEYFHSPYRDESPRSQEAMSQRRLSKRPMVPGMAAGAAGVAGGASQMPLGYSQPQPPMLSRASWYQNDGYDDFNPADIVDDPDDVFQDPAPRSRSRLSLGRPATAAAAGGVLGASMSGALPARASGLRDGSGVYQAVGPSQADLPEHRHTEKSDWLAEEEASKRKRKRWFIILGIVVVALIIVGAVLGGVLASRKNSSNHNGSGSTTTTSASSNAGTHSGGQYDIDSNEVQAVMGQQALHKVFPGMDYTPLNSQYPDCLHNPPDQNNITLDVAVLSQLTPAIRLYGTDCGQTEMVLTAIDRLKMNDTMQVWLGVWLGNNATTNSRQLSQMYSILDKYPTSHFAGIIIGNEVLFRQDMTLWELSNTLTQVRTNLTTKKISLPLATSDLGDNWTAGLAATSDIVMANIHPFFAGVTPDVASAWTWTFWKNKNSQLVPARTGSWPKSIVSEVGWPSEGGNDCGTGAGTCPEGKGAVASIDNMNTFMDGYVCPSLNNGTTFFWFSAFDEPWKAIFNTASDQWESKWGLMDVNRNLKSGLNIPDCGGKTVTKAY